MERAERNGSDLRRLLRCAERFNEAAMRLGSLKVKTPGSSVSASLCSVTSCDQRRRRVVGRRTEAGFRRRLIGLRAALLCRLDAAALFAMINASCWSARSEI